MRHILLSILLLCTTLSIAQSRVIGKTPQSDPAYALGVSGHGASLLKHKKKQILLMVGGCNFPDQPAADGGPKRYYREVYKTTYKHGKSIKKWTLIGSLPQPVAYAAYQTFDNSMIIAGGKSTDGDLRSVHRLSLSKDQDLIIHSLADLPEERSGMASAIVGTRLYLIGGVVSGRLSTSVISLDLSDPSAQWRQEPSLPGLPRLKLLATAMDYDGQEKIFAFGAFVGTEGTDSVSSGIAQYVYTPSIGQWLINEEIPTESWYDGYSLGGGMIYADRANTSIHLMGGVRVDKFIPALVREQAIRRARTLADTTALATYQAESKAYLSHAPEWYDFNPYTIFLSKHPLEDGLAVSISLDPDPNLRKADAAIVEVKPGLWLLLGGEIKPGVRTPDICQ